MSNSSHAFSIINLKNDAELVWGNGWGGNDNNMENLGKLIEIANAINAKDLEKDLFKIKERSLQTNADLIFPLVGEFSSGKTTLVNALTDSKKLETATKPTTATIYRLHFGCDHCYANVLNSDGTIQEYQDIADLKNEKLTDAIIVDVFDTSCKVPSTTILVDTPGLSSSAPRHKQALVDFLPQADAILLVTDINQQLTRSITEFVKTMELAKRPIFLVITKCDTKSTQDLEQAKKYISDNIRLPLQQVVCVSAVKNDLNELYDLFKKVQEEKTEIIKKVDEVRVKNAVKNLLERINELLNASSSDKDLEEALREQEFELKRLYRNIDILVKDISANVEEIGVKSVRQFEDIIPDKLEKLVTSNSANFDAEAISIINNTASLLLSEYKDDILTAFRRKANERKGKEEAVSLKSLENIDLSSLSVSGLNYNINLNDLGHKYDKAIAMATKIVVAAGAVYAGAAALGAGGGAVAATTADNILDAADTATDVMSMHSNDRTASRIEKAVSFVGRATDKMSSIDEYNQMAGDQVGANKGIVESMVGFVTDRTMGKPQRKRVIHNYMDETLKPSFKAEMKRINNLVISFVDKSLHQEATDIITQKKDMLEQLRKDYQEKKNEYEQRISQLRDYRNYLITL